MTVVCRCRNPLSGPDQARDSTLPRSESRGGCTGRRFTCLESSQPHGRRLPRTRSPRHAMHELAKRCLYCPHSTSSTRNPRPPQVRLLPDARRQLPRPRPQSRRGGPGRTVHRGEAQPAAHRAVNGATAGRVTMGGRDASSSRDPAREFLDLWTEIEGTCGTSTRCPHTFGPWVRSSPQPVVGTHSSVATNRSSPRSGSCATRSSTTHTAAMFPSPHPRPDTVDRLRRIHH